MEDFYEHIDDYKDGLLKGETLTAFETAMANDPSLRRAVDNYGSAKSISEGLLEIDMMETLKGLKNKVSKEESQHEENKHKIVKNKNSSPSISDRSIPISPRPSISETKVKTSVFNLRNWMAVASVLGIILFAGWWMTQSPYSHLDKEKILASFVDPMNEGAKKSVDTVGMTTFEKGMYYYTLNRYEKSEEWLKLSLEGEKDKKMKSKVYYWLGAAHLRQWEMDEAVEAWRESNEDEAKIALQIVN